MKKANLIENLCDRSLFCGAKRVCPVGAIAFKKTGFLSGYVVIDKIKCIGCGKCVNACPHDAIKMKR